jgi:hypothetical protein
MWDRKLTWDFDMTDSSDLKVLLKHIGNELMLLWAQLDAYQELYLVEQEKRRPLLKVTAPGFFAICQTSLAESILMRICRLMDPPRSCGEENSSLQHFCKALGKDANHSSLKAEIQVTIDDWNQKDSGSYVALKAVRNKWLAHNDFAKRSALQTDQLWIPLTHDDFEVARNLARLLWEIYRRIHRALYEKDVLEPIHTCLENRPSTVLRRLCESQFLSGLLDRSPELIGQLHSVEHQQMGDDSLRKVFDSEESPVSYQQQINKGE